ncbi:MAG: OsmC family protein [Chlamydiota bacterium]
MTKQFPLFFEIEASSESGIDKNWVAKNTDSDPVPIAIPPEFSGPGKGYSPEDLFAMACVNCMIATFKVYAQHANIQFQNITARATVTVDKDLSAHCLCMSNIDVTFTLKAPSPAEKAKLTLEKAIKDCAVCNSIKSVKSYHINIE